MAGKSLWHAWLGQKAAWWVMTTDRVFFKTWNWGWERTRGIKEVKQVMTRGVVNVWGHTHVAKLDLNAGQVNCGMVRWGMGSYVVVQEGKISLVRERYEA